MIDLDYEWMERFLAALMKPAFSSCSKVRPCRRIGGDVHHNRKRNALVKTGRAKSAAKQGIEHCSNKELLALISRAGSIAGASV